MNAQSEKIIEFDKVQKQNELLSDETFDKLFSLKNSEDREKEMGKLLQEAIKLNCKTKYEKKLRQKVQEHSINNDIETTYIFEDLELNIGSYIIDGKNIKDGNGKVICQQLVYPSAIYKNIYSDSQKIELKFKNSFGWQTRIIDRAKATDKNKLKEEAQYGLDMRNPNGMAEYINYLLVNNEQRIPYKKAVTHLGWTEYEDKTDIKKDFLPYDNNIVFDGQEGFKTYYDSIKKPRGNFEFWKENVQRFRKNLVLRLMTDASFASPLLEITGSLPFVMLLYGKTGKGKTVSLQVAASIWGNPSNEKLINSLDSTKNFAYRTMAFFHSIPCFFDELQLYTYSKDKLVMALTQGIDRGKANKDGGTENKETWRNCAIISGEETISSSDSGGGTLNRLIEIDIDEETKGESLFNGLTPDNGTESCKYASEFVAKQHFGHAGPMFIEFIRKLGNEKIFEMYKKRFDEVKKLNISEDKQVSTMANILLADDIVNMFMFNESEIKAEQIAKFLFEKNEIDKSERAYETFMNVIAEHNSNFVPRYSNVEQSKQPSIDTKKDFWGTVSEYELLVLRHKVDLILKEIDVPAKKTISDWLRKGYIQPDSEGKANHRTTVKEIGGGRVSFLKFVPIKEDNFKDKMKEKEKNGNAQLMPQLEEILDQNGILTFKDYDDAFKI